MNSEMVRSQKSLFWPVFIITIIHFRKARTFFRAKAQLGWGSPADFNRRPAATALILTFSGGRRIGITPFFSLSL
jgi:hypothetical protein